LKKILILFLILAMSTIAVNAQYPQCPTGIGSSCVDCGLVCQGLTALECEDVCSDSFVEVEGMCFMCGYRGGTTCAPTDTRCDCPFGTCGGSQELPEFPSQYVVVLIMGLGTALFLLLRRK
jgi:hypothetical protein